MELTTLVESASGSTTTCRTLLVAWVDALGEAAPEPDNCRLPHVFQTLVRVLSDYYEAALMDVTSVEWTVIVDAHRHETALFVEESLLVRHIALAGKVRGLEGDLDLVLDRHDRSFPEAGWCSIATVN